MERLIGYLSLTELFVVFRDFFGRVTVFVRGGVIEWVKQGKAGRTVGSAIPAVPVLKSNIASARKRMNDALARLTEFFEKRGWTYLLDDAESVVQTAFSGDNARWTCAVIVDEENESLLCVSRFPSRVPVKKHVACAELFTRINYGLKQGCFEMNFEDGDIRFRTTAHCAAASVSAEVVEHLLLSNLCVVDHFYCAVMKVLYGNASPKTALEESDEEASASPRFEFN